MRLWTIVLACSLSAVALAQTNLDFEHGANSRGVPAGWIGAPPAILWDPTV
jgi:hypothetical protein